MLSRWTGSAGNGPRPPVTVTFAYSLSTRNLESVNTASSNDW